MRREEPQINQNQMIPLLELDNVEKGRRIYKTNDQKKVHWQLNSYKIKGIDNEKEVLICEDSDKKPLVIPFRSLGDYMVMKFGYDSEDLIPLDFEIIAQAIGTLSRKARYRLDTHASTIKDGRVEVYYMNDEQSLVLSGPNEFHDLIKSMKADDTGLLHTWFMTYNQVSTQRYVYDLDSKAIKIGFKDRYYNLKDWAIKTNNK